MGHAVDYITVDKRKDIMRAAKEFAAHNVDRYEDPSGSYHGKMTIHDTPICDSYEAAYEFIQSHDRGWYDDHAVQFKDKSALKPTKQMETLMAKANKLQADKKDYLDKHSLRARKSEFMGCKKCNSKIAVKYIRGHKCPVCNAEMMSQTVVDRLKKYTTDREEVLRQIEQLRRKQNGKCPIRWLVKVEVHC